MWKQLDDTSVVIGQKFGRLSTDSRREKVQLVEADVLPAALDVRHRGAREPDPLGDMLLSQTSGLAGLPEVFAEVAVQTVHRGGVSRGARRMSMWLTVWMTDIDDAIGHAR